MIEILAKIWFLLVILPLTMATEGYERLKKFMAKHGYTPDWAWTLLIILIVLLVIILLLQYGYR